MAPPYYLLELLLGAQLVRVTTLLLAAVRGTRMQTRVTDTADLLVAVVFASQRLEGRLNNTTTKTENKMKRRLLLDVVVGKGAAVLELLSSEDETLLVRGNAYPASKAQR